jgi:hypothetical protein
MEMSVKPHLIDGNQTSAEQERALNFLEQSTFAKVISYSKKDAEPGANLNEALLEDVPIGEQPGTLKLQAIDANSDLTPAVTQNLQSGQVIVFHDIAYVSGVLKTVFGFR